MNRNKLSKLFLVPALLAALAFWVVKDTFAQLVVGDTLFLQSLGDTGVEVGVETIDGFSQIYYIKNNEKKFITGGPQNSKMPVTAGEYIAYVTDFNGSGQVFLYYVVSQTGIQLTNSSTNLKPSVSSDGKAAWERWVGDTWQIAIFDGIGIQRISTGNLSMNANIEGEYLVFSQKDKDGIWSAMGYSLNDGKFTTIDVGVESKFPKLNNGQIILDRPGSKNIIEPLKIEDMFLLDDSLPSPSSEPAL